MAEKGKDTWRFDDCRREEEQEVPTCYERADPSLRAKGAPFRGEETNLKKWTYYSD